MPRCTDAAAIGRGVVVIAGGLSVAACRCAVGAPAASWCSCCSAAPFLVRRPLPRRTVAGHRSASLHRNGGSPGGGCRKIGVARRLRSQFASWPAVLVLMLRGPLLRAPPAPPTNSRRTPVHTAAPPGPPSDGRAGRLRRADPGRRSYRQIAAAWPASGPGPRGRPTAAAAAWCRGCRGGNPPEVPGAGRIRPRCCARRSADRLPSSALPCGPLTRRQLTGSRRGRSDVQAIERDGGHLHRRVFTDDDRASRCTRAPERAQNMPLRARQHVLIAVLGAPGGIRTRTGTILSGLPLPVGLRGRCVGGRHRQGRRPSGPSDSRLARPAAGAACDPSGAPSVGVESVGTEWSAHDPRPDY